MTLFRRIAMTVLATTAAYVAIFIASFLLIRIALSLKDLSYETLSVLSEWNALDKASNDLLYRRIDSVSLLGESLEKWTSRSEAVDRALEVLRGDAMLAVLPEASRSELERVGYIWTFTSRRLEAAHDILTGLLGTEGGIDLGAATLLEGIQRARDDPGRSYEERRPYMQFLANIAVLDIVGDEIDTALAVLIQDIPRRLDRYIGFLLVGSLVGLGTASVLSVAAARRAVRPIMDLSAAMERIRSGDFSMHMPVADKDEIGIINEGVEAMLETIRALISDSLRKEEEKRDAERRALQAQINPHFLFNTLGSLQLAMALRGDKAGSEGLKSLSRILRSALGRGGGFHSLERELAFLEDYVAVMQLRYEGRITYERSVPDELMDLSVPRLILQPLVENAIQHGLSDRLNRMDLPAVLRIEAAAQDDAVAISIYDNGVGMARERFREILAELDGSAPGDHIGLANTAARLKLLFGAEEALGMESDGSSCTRITLRLPREQSR